MASREVGPTTVGDQAATAPVRLQEPERTLAMIDGLRVGNGHAADLRSPNMRAANKHAQSVQAARQIHPTGVPIWRLRFTRDLGSAVNSQHESQENQAYVFAAMVPSINH